MSDWVRQDCFYFCSEKKATYGGESYGSMLKIVGDYRVCVSQYCKVCENISGVKYMVSLVTHVP